MSTKHWQWSLSKTKKKNSQAPSTGNGLYLRPKKILKQQALAMVSI
jgi:hypothetical protein